MSPSPTDSTVPTKLPDQEDILEKFRKSAEAQQLVEWVKTSQDKARKDRSRKQIQWQENMAMFFGLQYAEQVRGTQSGESVRQLRTSKAPAYKKRKTINHTRSFVRSELAKFLASVPSAVAVPGSSEDTDFRAASAAEQVWESTSQSRKLRYHYKRAAWWAILTGTGFIKVWWDDECVVDPAENVRGDIRFGAVTTPNLYIPDLREPNIEDQNFVINSYKKSVEWCQHYYGKELGGRPIEASSSGTLSFLEEGFVNLGAQSKQDNDSVTVYEAWVKPGATKLLPNGGLVIIVADVIVSISMDGLPYSHGMYPFVKLDHIDTDTFYGDSPLVDTNQLQREYNELRTDIAHAGRLMARPQLLVQKGSVQISRITNEAGSMIEYLPGSPAPQPLQLSPLPQYYVEQQDRVMSDWENITGQHEVSKGTAPAGITSGTAINYLQEKDNEFLSSQHQNIEEAYEKIAIQTIALFVQYVDVKRRIKVIGTDSAFDSLLLDGADIRNGSDIRIQKGSSVGESKAAKDARIMDMWAAQIITDPNLALKLLEMGGTDKILDIINVAEKQAQRENVRLKMLDPLQIEQAITDQQAQVAPVGLPEIDELTGLPAEPMQQEPQTPLLIQVNDYDIHEVHIETHNKFRMGQEYDTLDPRIKEQFELHVGAHKQAVMEKQMLEQFQNQDSGPPMPEAEDGTEMPPEGDPSAMMPPEGAAPAGPPMEGM